jgi:enoyl-CoA hydratase/carnithine racemase
MSEERVTIEISGHVAVARMNRAEKHNALDAAMFTGLAAAAERLRGEPGIRAVVLCGDGPSFCSGLDVASFMSGPMTTDDLMSREPGSIANLAQRVAYDWSLVPVPVIAAVHGVCFGGGLQIALGADLRIAAPDARLAILEIKWGLVPDMAITQSLPRLVGSDVAKELTFTGRILDGTQAHALGLVTRVANDPLAAAHELAEEIAEKSPHAIRAGKRLLNEAWNAPAADALLLESELQLALLGSANQIAAITAGVTKQPAVFADPV